MTRSRNRVESPTCRRPSQGQLHQPDLSERSAQAPQRHWSVDRGVDWWTEGEDRSSVALCLRNEYEGNQRILGSNLGRHDARVRLREVGGEDDGVKFSSGERGQPLLTGVGVRDRVAVSGQGRNDLFPNCSRETNE